ncbi:MAG: pilus assembly protein [Alphaproteobacteria bacterium PRO2]|nr:pilus assembly protein [Alphaproteobacteria bacterium PRO2]
MLRKFISRWLGKDEGTTAIEFSFLLVPYILLTLAIIEISIMYVGASLLEGATGSAARLVRTGQLQEGADPEALFRQAICNYATVLINCDNVIIEVREMESFSDYDEMQPQYDEDGNLVPGQFDAGGSSSRVLIRSAYRYTMMTPIVGALLGGPDNSRLFVSTIVLQTEPYDFEG